MMTWVEMVVVRRVKAWLHLLRLRIENNDDGDGDDDSEMKNLIFDYPGLYQFELTEKEGTHQSIHDHDNEHYQHRTEKEDLRKV